MNWYADKSSVSTCLHVQTDSGFQCPTDCSSHTPAQELALSAVMADCSKGWTKGHHNIIQLSAASPRQKKQQTKNNTVLVSQLKKNNKTPDKVLVSQLKKKTWQKFWCLRWTMVLIHSTMRCFPPLPVRYDSVTFTPPLVTRLAGKCSLDFWQMLTRLHGKCSSDFMANAHQTSLVNAHQTSWPMLTSFLDKCSPNFLTKFTVCMPSTCCFCYHCKSSHNRHHPHGHFTTDRCFSPLGLVNKLTKHTNLEHHHGTWWGTRGSSETVLESNSSMMNLAILWSYSHTSSRAGLVISCKMGHHVMLWLQQFHWTSLHQVFHKQNTILHKNTRENKNEKIIYICQKENVLHNGKKKFVLAAR